MRIIPFYTHNQGELGIPLDIFNNTRLADPNISIEDAELLNDDELYMVLIHSIDDESPISFTSAIQFLDNIQAALDNPYTREWRDSDDAPVSKQIGDLFTMLVINNKSKLLQVLVDNNKLIPSPDESSQLLIDTADKISASTLSILHEIGGDINTKDENGTSFIFLCTYYKNIQALKYLIDAGIDPSIPDAYYKVSPVVYARYNMMIGICKIFGIKWNDTGWKDYMSGRVAKSTSMEYDENASESWKAGWDDMSEVLKNEKDSTPEMPIPIIESLNMPNLLEFKDFLKMNEQK